MDVLVYRYKTLLMQRLIDWTQKGYHAWTCGTVDGDRAFALCEKFDTLYFVTRNKHQRYHAKKNGGGNAVLLLADLDKDGRLAWWLLVTPGTHAAWTRETLRDSRERPTRVLITGYEMVQLQNDRRNGGVTRWTWRMTEDTYGMWETSIRGTVRGRHPRTELPVLLKSLTRVPGFHGSRSQVDRLKKLIANEWRRASLGDLDLSTVKTPWTRLVANENYKVLDWIRDRNSTESASSREIQPLLPGISADAPARSTTPGGTATTA